MTLKTNPPSISETAFDCPHCGAYTTQYWFKVFANSSDNNTAPHIPNEETKNKITTDTNLKEEMKTHFLEWCDKMNTGLVYLDRRKDGRYVYNDVNNLNLSKCFNCKKIAVWIHNNLIFPSEKIGIAPNQDLHEEIIRDFEEARTIIGLSPRGAAALLRLCIQKLCIQLDEKGENINDDIANLVTKGLSPTLQKSLDIVRVVGNEAVHPGELDLKDDRDTAIKLLKIINSIADQ